MSELSGGAYEALLSELDALMDAFPEEDAALEGAVLGAAHGVVPLENALRVCGSHPGVAQALLTVVAERVTVSSSGVSAPGRLGLVRSGPRVY